MISVLINGTTYEIPEVGEEGWGEEVTGWIVAASSYLLQRSGGNFPLSSDANFGGTAGLVSLYYKSRTSNIATAGIVRLANADTIQWRNFANGGNLSLVPNSSDKLTFNGAELYTSSTTVARSQIAAGTADHVVINASGTGLLSSEAQLSKSRGGTGADNSSVTFPSSGTIPTLSSSDTLSNKTLASPAITGYEDIEEVSTPSTPSAGSLRVFATTGSQLAIKNSAGTTTVLGSGSGNLAVTTKSANYTATGSDDLILCNAVGGAFTITLPSAGSNTGKVLRIKKTDSSLNTVTISGATRTLDFQNEAYTLVSDGSNWIELDHDLNAVVVIAGVSGSQSVSNNTLTTVNFVAASDTFGLFNDTTHIYTAQKAGYYLVESKVSFAGNATSIREVCITVNGTVVSEMIQSVVASDAQSLTIAKQLLLAKGDTVKIQALQASGGNLDIIETISQPSAATHFTISLLK